MTIALTGAGSLFVRLGHVFGPARDLLALMGAAATSNIASGTRFPARSTLQNTDAYAGTAIPITVANQVYAPYAALANWQGAQGNYFQWASGYAKAILSAMVSLDQGVPENPALPATFTVPYLINQMFFASAGTYAAPAATLQQCTLSIGAQTAGIPAPVGNPTIVLGTKSVFGQTLQLVFPETITFTCTRDQQGGATVGNETLSFAGLPAVQNPFSQQYPGGSGCSGSLSLVDGSKSNSAGNMLQNSGVLTITTTGIADNWSLLVGVVTTDITASLTGGYKTSTGYIQFIGTGGAVLDAVTQSFNTTPATTVGGGGTSVALLPDTQYCVSVAIKCSSVPTAGVFELALTDGANNVLADDTGVNNLTTFNLASGGLNVGATYQVVSTTFRTPANLTTQTTPFKLRMRLSTAIDSGKTLFMSCVAMTPMTPLYAGGPPCAAFSGSTPVLDGLTPDAWTFAVTNTYGQFSLWLDRVFGLRANGWAFPYSGSPSVADSLIV